MLRRACALSPVTCWLALAVVLGGAVSATAATVQIQGAGGEIADVDRSGALSTTAVPAPPRVPFAGFIFATAGLTTTLIGPSNSTAVLTSFTLGNNYDQTNGGHASAFFSITQSTTNSCSGDAGSQVFSKYYAAAGQSFQATYPGGFVLKPDARGHWWCLTAFVSVQGNPGTYFIPELSWIGYVERGTLTAAQATESNPDLALRPPRH